MELGRWARKMVAGSFPLAVWAFSVGGIGRLEAVDFLRGDANGDGAVTLADAYFSLLYLFEGTVLVECLKAGDANASMQFDITDVVVTLNFLASNEPAPPPPFPQIGPEPTQTPLDCDSYGHGAPLPDPAAKIEILSAEAPGGPEGQALLTISLSNSREISGFRAHVRESGGVFKDQSIPMQSIVDLTGNGTPTQFFMAAEVKNDLVRIDYLLWRVDSPPSLPPGAARPVIQVPLCLKPGTAAGEYPLTLEVGELVDTETGRAINPTLASGTLEVLTAVGQNPCVIDPNRTPINVRFKLGDGSGSPGSPVSIPFSIKSDRPSQGFGFSVDFDESVLEATEIEKLWSRPGGTPYELAKFEFNTSDSTPGNGGLDEGFLVGVAILSLVDDASILPPSRNVDVLNFHFNIKPDAPVGTTELKFLDGGQVSGGPVQNKLIAQGSFITPSLASSFVFVNGRINIIDVTVFIRADSNGDQKVEMADAIYTLEYLFRGGPAPRCLEAADADDNGNVDVTDPIVTLSALFLGTAAIPPPNGSPGRDPTPDALGCGPAPR